MERYTRERGISPAVNEDLSQSEPTEAAATDTQPYSQERNRYGGWDGQAVNVSRLFDHTQSPYENMWHSVVDEY